MTRDPRTSCHGKRGYETRPQAWRALHYKHARTHRRDGLRRKSAAYYCAHCGYFHHGRVPSYAARQEEQ